MQFKLVSFKGQLYFFKITVLQTEAHKRTWFGIPFALFHKHFPVLLKVQRVITVAAILNMLSMLYDNLHNYSVITGEFLSPCLHDDNVNKELLQNYIRKQTLINKCVSRCA